MLRQKVSPETFLIHFQCSKNPLTVKVTNRILHKLKDGNWKYSRLVGKLFFSHSWRHRPIHISWSVQPIIVAENSLEMSLAPGSLTDFRMLTGRFSSTYFIFKWKHDKPLLWVVIINTRSRVSLCNIKLFLGWLFYFTNTRQIIR